MKILIDMDDVIADTLEYTITCLNEAGVFVDRNKLLGRYLEDILPKKEIDIMHDVTSAEFFFRNIPIKKDCYEVLRKINEKHDIRIVSCAFVFPQSMNSKFYWIKQNLDFIDARQIIFCGSKSDLMGDILIDDLAENLRGFNGEKLLFSAPHNVNIKEFHRLDSWRDVEKVLL